MGLMRALQQHQEWLPSLFHYLVYLRMEIILFVIVADDAHHYVAPVRRHNAVRQPVIGDGEDTDIDMLAGIVELADNVLQAILPGGEPGLMCALALM